MKSCNGCVYAEWQKTSNGRLHPSGDGKCTYKWKMPELPACMYFVGTPCVGGRGINRRNEFTKHCVYFAREAK